MDKLSKYRELEKQGYTILGLYKTGKQDGMTPDEVVAMLNEVLPRERDETVRFMRKMEFGEEFCMICQKLFIDKAGEWCNINCPDCQKRIDEMWEMVYDAQDGLSEDELIRTGILINLSASLAADSLVVQEANGTQENQGSEAQDLSDAKQEN